MSRLNQTGNDITHLRNLKQKPDFQEKQRQGRHRRRERRFATDFFMIVAYSLFGFAVLAQLFLITWLEFT